MEQTYFTYLLVLVPFRRFYGNNFDINNKLFLYVHLKLRSTIIMSLISNCFMLVLVASMAFADRCYEVKTADLPNNICRDCVYSDRLSGPLMCG